MDASMNGLDAVCFIKLKLELIESSYIPVEVCDPQRKSILQCSSSWH